MYAHKKERKTPQKRNSAAKVQRNRQTAKYFSTFYSLGHEIEVRLYAAGMRLQLLVVIDANE